MGSVGTPFNGTNVIPQNTERVSVPQYNQDHLIHEGSVKRKRANNKTNDNPSSNCKRKAYDEDDDEIFSDNNLETDTSSNTSDGSSNLGSSQSKQIHSSKDYKQPPVVVTLNNKLTLLQIKSLINKENLEVTYKCNGKHVTIIPKKIEAHAKMIEVLNSVGAEFHTYARKSEIKPKIVLKGLPVLPVEVISNEILRHNIKTNSIYMPRAKTNNNLNTVTYLITVDSLSDLKEIIKIKYISCIVVTWEKYIKKQKITQCFNCQKFGHGKSNCHRITICMKYMCK